LPSLTHNLNLNQEMKKTKKNLPNKTRHFKTSNHVEIHTKLGDFLHDFDNTADISIFLQDNLKPPSHSPSYADSRRKELNSLLEKGVFKVVCWNLKC
jgi:hypothetical protein